MVAELPKSKGGRHPHFIGFFLFQEPFNEGLKGFFLSYPALYFFKDSDDKLES